MEIVLGKGVFKKEKEREVSKNQETIWRVYLAGLSGLSGGSVASLGISEDKITGRKNK